MKVKVTRNNVIITETKSPNSGSYKESHVEFDLSSDYDELVNKAVFFSVDNQTNRKIMNINDGVCDYPAELLNEAGDYFIGVYGFEVENEELKLRLSPEPQKFTVKNGSYVEGMEEGSEITPTQFEQYCAEMERLAREVEESLEGIDNIDISGQKVGKITTITITKKDGTTEEFELEDGMGLDYIWNGTSLGIKREDEQNYTYVDLKGEKGEPGAIKMRIVQELPQTGSDDTIYLVPLASPESQENNYAEYIYINGNWELLGKIGIHVDLSDYYTKQETNALLDGKADTSDIPDLTDYVKNTDYATSSKGGVVKVGRGSNILPDGTIYANVYNYSGYNSADNSFFISKGTLENVIAGKELTDKTYVDGLVGDISSAIDLINGESV